MELKKTKLEAGYKLDQQSIDSQNAKNISKNVPKLARIFRSKMSRKIVYCLLAQ